MGFERKDRMRSWGCAALWGPDRFRLARVCRLGMATWVGFILLVGLGCYGGSNGTGAALWPPFSLGVSPDALSVPAGGGGYATVTVSRRWGFAGAIALSLEGAPAGVVASGTIPAGAQTGTLAIRVDGALAPQSLDGVRVKGASGSEVQTATFRLVVAAPLPVGQIGSDLVQANGGVQRGGSFENTPVVQEPARALPAKDATDHTEIRHGFEPAALNH